MFDPVTAVGAGVQKYTDVKEGFKERLNGTLPPGSIPFSDPTGKPTGVFFNEGTGKFYKKVGFLWKSWKEFPTKEAAESASGGFRQGRRRSHRRSNRRRRSHRRSRA